MPLNQQHRNYLSVALALYAVLPTTAQAENKDKQQNPDYSVIELGQMDVTDSRISNGKLSSRDILSSVDIMNASKIENQNVLTSYDLFHQCPVCK